MKKMIIGLLLFVSIDSFSQQAKYSFTNLIGKWRNSNGAGLDVEDSNTVYLVHGNQRKLAFASRSDFSKNPVALNLVVKDSSRVITLKSLLMFMNDDLLQWQVFDTETKPASFNYDRSDMLFLRKIEEWKN